MVLSVTQVIVKVNRARRAALKALGVALPLVLLALVVGLALNEGRPVKARGVESADVPPAKAMVGQTSVISTVAVLEPICMEVNADGTSAKSAEARVFPSGRKARLPTQVRWPSNWRMS